MAKKMKEIADIRSEIKASLTRGARNIYKPPQDDAWPMKIALNPPSANSMAGSYSKIRKWALAIHTFAKDNRMHYETTENWMGIPTRIIVPDEKTACACVGMTNDLERRDDILSNCRKRGMSETDAWTFLSMVKDKDRFPDAKIEILLKTGTWARGHVTKGLAPRQVPIPGVQGKILDSKTNRDIICLVAGKDDLGLIDAESMVYIHNLDRSAPYEFTCALPGRKDDRSQARPEKIPHTVVIVENKATFRWFPSMHDTVVIYGEGFKADKYIPEITWLSEVDDIVYWGDMDTAGLKILAGIRQAGIKCRSILMDDAGLAKYGHLGTAEDKNGKPIAFDPNEPVPDGLTDEEARLFKTLNSKNAECRRIEQEKIPYKDAIGLIFGNGIKQGTN